MDCLNPFGLIISSAGISLGFSPRGYQQCVSDGHDSKLGDGQSKLKLRRNAERHPL